MCKIKFYMLPSTCYDSITVDDLYVFEKNINAIKVKDLFFVPNDFYYQTDLHNVTALEYLYESEQNDVNTYLLEIISKEMATDTDYELISEQAYIGYVAFAKDSLNQEYEKICVYNSEDDIIKVKRFYIMQVKSYEEYLVWIKDCFPNLIFHEDAFDSMGKLGRFQDVKEELHRHLVVLCDNAKVIYYECGKREEDAFSILRAKHGIICSGKGSNEKEFKVDYHGVRLTCNPHTKLFTEYSNQRIYFCWGREDIENHNIIVVKIGDHWK